MESDLIVGIKCEFVNCRPLFILAVYLPSVKRLKNLKNALIISGFCMILCQLTVL